MKKTKCSEEQITFALRQAARGTRVEELCRPMGISPATFSTGRRSSVAEVSLNCAVFASSKRKTPGSKNR
ncbi:MAG: transposase [Chlorobaculum sp.]